MRISPMHATQRKPSIHPITFGEHVSFHLVDMLINDRQKRKDAKGWVS